MALVVNLWIAQIKVSKPSVADMTAVQSDMFIVVPKEYKWIGLIYAN